MSAPTSLFAALAAAVAVALMAQPAFAVILPASTIDGPSADIVDFGGVAMAEDGTGGLVYLKRVGGVPHVFVARFVGGQWLAPIRVDNEEPYAASWPRIGAAEGGVLVVVWATPFGTLHGHPEDQLLSATLGPGATGFGPATLIDPDIGAGLGTSPDLAMSSTGQADLVYRVVESEPGATTIALLRPGDVVEEVRVAHFQSGGWSALGSINRNPGASMRAPTESNAPQVAVGPTGSGIVVWQEPEVGGVARIWGRRLFGSRIEYVMPVTATSLNGAPLNGDADAPAVAVSRKGLAEVAYRQLPGPGSPLAGARIFLNLLPDGESASGAEFTGAGVLDANEVAGGAAASVGPPSIDVGEKQHMRLLYDSQGTPRVFEGNASGLTGALSFGPEVLGAAAASATTVNSAGGGVSAWPAAGPQGPTVAIREDFPNGAAQSALLGGGGGGPVSELAVGRSGIGDGLVGFLQGAVGNAAVIAAQVSAPPQTFAAAAPARWIKPSFVNLSWEAAPSSAGPVRYGVVLDGRSVGSARLGPLTARVNARGLGTGRHRLQVLATDSYGDAALSATAPLLVERDPPLMRVSRTKAGNGVEVEVSDIYSGVETRSVQIDFGDGIHLRGHAHGRHRYSHPGIYHVVVRSRSKLGNQGVYRQPVNVR